MFNSYKHTDITNIISMMATSLYALILLISVAAATPVDYTGFAVVRFDIANQREVNFLERLAQNEKFIQDEHPLVVGGSTTLGIPPSYVSDVMTFASKIKMNTHVIYEDLQEIIDLEKATIDRTTALDEFDFDVFHTYDSIVDQMLVWNSTCPDGLSCEMYSYGKTYEGRDLWTLKIGRGSGYAYWFHGVTHAREWISTATLLKIMNGFWSEYGSDAVITEYLDNYDWYLTPVTNPDGYVHSHNGDRMQRKNRGINADSNCRGTDLNRNYDVVWGTEGVTHLPCDPSTYCGDYAASELETQAIQTELQRVSSQQSLLAMVDMHSFGNMILMPYSYSVNHTEEVCAQAPKHDDYMQVSNAFADACQETFETEWIRGSPCEILYTVSGGSIDWSVVYGGALYAFTPELRGPFFTTSPDNIQPSYEEFWNGVIAMEQEIKLIEGL